jgi:hypothetical protein
MIVCSERLVRPSVVAQRSAADGPGRHTTSLPWPAAGQPRGIAAGLTWARSRHRRWLPHHGAAGEVPADAPSDSWSSQQDLLAAELSAKGW